MRGAIEFDIAGRPHRASRMDARTQMHIARRVTPLLVGLIPPMISQLKARAASGEKTDLLAMNMDAVLPGLASAANMLAQMPDEEFNYIQTECLKRVERQKDGDTGWVKIWNDAAGRPQFDDIEGHQILLIMVEVLRAEIGPFLVGLVSSMTGDNLP